MPEPRPPAAPRLAPLLVAPLLVTLVACFDDPVEERLTLDLSAGSSARIALEITAQLPARTPSDTLYARRLRQLESELLAGAGPWNDRFARLDGRWEGQSWERRDGWLSRFERWAASDEPGAAFAAFFRDTPLQVDLARGEGRLGLWITAGPPNRASRDERREAERGLTRFAEAVEVHLQAVRALWRHLDRHPERADPLLRALFADLLEDEEPPPLTPTEEELIALCADAEDAVLRIFELDEERAPRTLQELSRRVWDPFPAALEVAPPEGGRLLEIEGFQVDAEGRLLAPRTSLWDSYPAAAGRWASPDPLLAKIRHATAHPRDPFPVEAFAAEPRLAAGPAPRREEIRDAVLAALAPPATLSAVWAVD